MKKYSRFIGLAMFALSLSVVSARVGETQAEVEERYGKPVSKEASRNVDPDYDPHPTLTAEERARSLELERHDFPEHFNPDGTRIDLVGEDAMIEATSRLVFFDPETDKWEDLRSNIVGRGPTAQDSDAVKQMTANARKHLRQRFYIFNGIGISVVYLGGRSVSEAYHQKERIFERDFVDTLIGKSFPECALVDEDSSKSYPRLIKILSSDSKEFKGCATYLDGVLTVTAVPYYGLLKAMETGLQRNAKIKQDSKLDGF